MFSFYLNFHLISNFYLNLIVFLKRFLKNIYLLSKKIPNKKYEKLLAVLGHHTRLCHSNPISINESSF
jgi:hypothetical protein